MTHEINASEHDLAYVRDTLRRLAPGREVFAFGSRVNGRARPFSDLDLAIIGDAPIPAQVLAELNDAFDESDLPFKVDILDWATTDETFRAIIRGQATPLLIGGVPEAAGQTKGDS